MANFTNNFENRAARPGLHRVWMPLHDDGRAPLISIWIDPTMTAFEPQPHQESLECSVIGDTAFSEEVEDSMRCLGVAPVSARTVAEIFR